MNASRRLRQGLTLVVVLAAAGFLYHTAARNWSDLSRFQWQIDVGTLLLSIAAHVLVLAWGVAVWARVLRYFPVAPPSYPALLRIWALSNATRYIPGAVWQFFAAAHLSRQAGLPASVALTSMVVHVAFSLLAAVTMAAATLPLEQLGGPVAGNPAAPLGVFLLAVLAVHPSIINGSLRLLGRVTRRDTLAWQGSWLRGVELLLLSVLSWLLYGVAYHLFVASLTPVSWGSLPLLAGINALSFAAGYVAILAPGGLGVRESAMTVMLSAILPAGVAAIVSIAARLWSVVAEVALAAAGVGWAAAAERAAAER